MLVKDLISLLNQVPQNCNVVLNIPVTDEVPLLVELYADDFALDVEGNRLEIDGDIDEDTEDLIEQVIDEGLKPNDMLYLSRDVEPTSKKQKTAARIKALGITVYTNELKTGFK